MIVIKKPEKELTENTVALLFLTAIKDVAEDNLLTNSEPWKYTVRQASNYSYQ
jgi:hypothetical protein